MLSFSLIAEALTGLIYHRPLGENSKFLPYLAINKLQKEIRTKINLESTISWEKFCNSISLKSDPKKSWCKITNFLKPKGPRSYAMLKLGNKTAKTNPKNAQLFAKSVKRDFGIESHLFRKSHFDRINKFIEAHSYHFTPLDSIHDSTTDTDDDSDLVADVDPDTLIRIVRTELKNGKAPGIDNVHNIILKKAIGTDFYKLLARAFTISLKLGLNHQTDQLTPTTRCRKMR